MKINANSIRPGNLIKYKDKLCLIIKSNHTQPGKGGAYLQVELKDIIRGIKINERFRSSQSLEIIRLEEKEFQILFHDTKTVTCMNNENFEQFTLTSDIVGDRFPYLKDGIKIIINFYDKIAVSIKLPTYIKVMVKETEPIIKRQTATSSYKPALLENGLRIMVPPHINAGTNIMISTENNTYLERAKN